MAEAGNDIVVDHVPSEQWRLIDCLRVLAAFEIVFVGVRCSAAEPDRRERARGQAPTAFDRLRSLVSAAS